MPTQSLEELELTATVKDLLDKLPREQIWEIVKQLPSHPQFSPSSLVRNMDSTQRGVFAQKVMSVGINCMGGDQEFLEGYWSELQKEHRTLQQSQLKTIFGVIEKFAEFHDEGYFDGRNEHSLKACAQVRDLWKETGGRPYTPLI